MKLIEYIIEERKFLHDISNHVVIVEGMLSSSTRKLSNSNDLSLEIERLNKSLLAAIKIRESIVARKAFVESVQETIAD